MAVVEYKIVSHEDLNETEEQVNTLLKEGWGLHGDLKVIENTYSQAMIREEPYGGIDYNLFVTIEDLEMIRYALDEIGDALGSVAKALASDKPTE